MKSPPHPRGSTATCCSRWRRPAVSPAPAGIDPTEQQRERDHAGLPRTRGDRPPTLHPNATAGRSPPHPRGSTVGGIPCFSADAVSPAPAGIDPALRTTTIVPVSLPRTRGDRPYSGGTKWSSRLSPPHPRGSTRAGTRDRCQLCVSPAPAGIDPPRNWRQRNASSLPRTRGDRPPPASTYGPARRSPPHPRGSTPGMAVAGRRGIVSPAPAGIDPSA